MKYGFVRKGIAIPSMWHSPEALHGGVIIAVTFPAHRYLHTKLSKYLSVFVGTVLAPTIQSGG